MGRQKTLGQSDQPIRVRVNFVGERPEDIRVYAVYVADRVSRRAPSWLPAAAIALAIGGGGVAAGLATRRPSRHCSRARTLHRRETRTLSVRHGRRRTRTEPDDDEIDGDPLFERTGRNPGRPRTRTRRVACATDAPAWFELNHLDPPMPESAAFSLAAPQAPATASLPIRASTT